MVVTPQAKSPNNTADAPCVWWEIRVEMHRALALVKETQHRLGCVYGHHRSAMSGKMCTDFQRLSNRWSRYAAYDIGA